MKPKKIKLILSISFLLTRTIYAADSFVVNPPEKWAKYPIDAKFVSKSNTRSDLSDLIDWRTEQTGSVEDGSQLSYYLSIHRDGSEMISTEFEKGIIANTKVVDLMPKGSNIAHGLSEQTGYIEHVWPIKGNLTVNDILVYDYNPFAFFIARIYDSTGQSSHSYLYKLNQKTGTVGNNPPHYDNKQAILNLGERNDTPQINIDALHQRSLLVSEPKFPLTSGQLVFYGEYNHSDQDWVALWKSEDKGDTWTKMIEWNTQGHQTGHINGVVENPYNGWIYILLGGDDSESAIVAWDRKASAPPNNTPLDQMSNYPGWKVITGANARTGDLVFTKDKTVWIPDGATLPTNQKLYGQMANHDLSGWQQTGEVPFQKGYAPILGTISDFERSLWDQSYPRTPSPVLFWISSHESTAPEQKIHIWKSEDNGLNWSLWGKPDIYTDKTAIPHDVTALERLKTCENNEIIQPYTLQVSGRDLEFVANGQKTGSTGIYTLRKQLSTNSAPIAQDDLVVITPTRLNPNSAFFPQYFEVIKNDTDSDNNLDFSKSDIVSIGRQPTQGVVAGNWTNFNYTPNIDYKGGADEFTYQIKDSCNQLSNTATVRLYGRVAYADTATTTKNTATTIPILANDFVAEGGPNTVSIDIAPFNGTAVVNPDNTITYTPPPGFTGEAAFTYKVDGGSQYYSTMYELVTIIVKDTATPPPADKVIANNDTFTITTTGDWGEYYDFSAANGVGANDSTDINTKNRFFKVISPLTRVSGSGNSRSKLFFRNNGGFGIRLHSTASTAEARKEAKRGSYQFSYTLTVKGVKSKPATATIVVQ